MARSIVDSSQKCRSFRRRLPCHVDRFSSNRWKPIFVAPLTGMTSHSQRTLTMASVKSMPETLGTPLHSTANSSALVPDVVRVRRTAGASTSPREWLDDIVCEHNWGVFFFPKISLPLHFEKTPKDFLRIKGEQFLCADRIACLPSPFSGV